MIDKLSPSDLVLATERAPESKREAANLAGISAAARVRIAVLHVALAALSLVAAVLAVVARMGGGGNISSTVGGI